MSKSLRFTVGLMLALAACGGSTEESAAPSTVAPEANDTTVTTAAAQTTTTTTTAAPAANPSDDFCEFLIAYVDETEFSPVGLSPDEVEELFVSNLGAINQATELAPPEIRGDVNMFATAYAGFVELLAEIEFNFLAMANVDPDDPRLAALESPELEEAGDRIEAYCGIDNFIATSPTPPNDPGDSSAGGTFEGGELPTDFPTELLPEGAELAVVLNVQGADSVTYDVVLAADEVIAFYTDLLGAAAAELSDPKGALWITSYAGTSLTVTVAETDATMTQVNILLS